MHCTVLYRYNKVSSEAVRKSAAGASTCLAVLFFVISNREFSCANALSTGALTFLLQDYGSTSRRARDAAHRTHEEGRATRRGVHAHRHCLRLALGAGSEVL